MVVTAEDSYTLAGGKVCGRHLLQMGRYGWAWKQGETLMKKTIIGMSLIALLTGERVLGAPLPAPGLRVGEALKIASAYLASHESGKNHFISALRLERASLLRKDLYWAVEWTPAIDLGNLSEIGLRISMDGTVKRLVEPHAGGGRTPRVVSLAR